MTPISDRTVVGTIRGCLARKEEPYVGPRGPERLACSREALGAFVAGTARLELPGPQRPRPLPDRLAGGALLRAVRAAGPPPPERLPGAQLPQTHRSHAGRSRRRSLAHPQGLRGGRGRPPMPAGLPRGGGGGRLRRARRRRSAAGRPGLLPARRWVAGTGSARRGDLPPGPDDPTAHVGATGAVRRAGFSSFGRSATAAGSCGGSTTPRRGSRETARRGSWTS